MELSEYTFETLRKDGEFIVYRGHHRRQTDASPPSILVMTPVSERPARGSLRRMEHEYSLRAELDPGWAVRPLGLAPHKGRMMLVLADPGGEPLDRLLGRPMELTQFLRLAIGLSAALGQLHERSLIHKDIKPANILVNPRAEKHGSPGLASPHACRASGSRPRLPSPSPGRSPTWHPNRPDG